MSSSLHQTEGGSAAQTLPAHDAQNDSLPDELREHVHQLRVILPVISVSVLALRRQHAEADVDIANVLSKHACGPLDSEIERIENLLARNRWQRLLREART